MIFIVHPNKVYYNGRCWWNYHYKLELYGPVLPHKYPYIHSERNTYSLQNADAGRKVFGMFVAASPHWHPYSHAQSLCEWEEYTLRPIRTVSSSTNEEMKMRRRKKTTTSSRTFITISSQNINEYYIRFYGIIRFKCLMDEWIEMSFAPRQWVSIHNQHESAFETMGNFD